MCRLSGLQPVIEKVSGFLLYVPVVNTCSLSSPDESLILTFPKELGLKPVEVTILEDGKIGINVPDEVMIVRSELLVS